MHDLPRPRTEGIVIQHVDDELVVYDRVSHEAHCLSHAAASVWECSNGERSTEDIGRELAMEPDLVARALAELSRCDLLDEGAVAVRDYSRREAAVKMAKVGGAAVTVPLIYSAMIRPAIAAASCIVNGAAAATCTAGSGNTATDAACCSGTCYHGTGSIKTCVPATCSPAGSVCVLVGNSCCSGSCALLICQT